MRSTRVLAATPLFLLACGSDTKATQEHAPCHLLGERIAYRLRLSEPERSNLRSSVDRNTSAGAYLVALNDVRASHSAAFRLGAICLNPRVSSECLTRPPPQTPDDVDNLFASARTLADGFLGKGSCAGRPVQLSEACPRLGQQLELAIGTNEIPQVIRDWPGKDLARDLSGPEQRSLERVSEWRAYLDYANALIPACVPENARASCARLAGAAASVEPNELVATIRSLARAFQERGPCGSAAK